VVVHLETNEKMFFQRVADAEEYYNKSYVFSYTTMEKSGKIKKLM